MTMGLFRDRDGVKLGEIEALAGLKPLRDDVFLYLLEQALAGSLPVYFAAAPPALIDPFDAGYEPERHPVGVAAVDACVRAALRGDFQNMWVYPKGNRFALSDDYIPWAATKRGRPDFVPCLVLGEPKTPGIVDVQGPLALDLVRRFLFGAAE